MADLNSYITPDGRRLQLPPVFASQFVGLQQAPPAAPELPAPAAIPTPPPGQAAPPIPGGEPAWTPDNTAALAAATPPPPMPTDGPVTSPDQMPPSSGKPVVPRGPVVTPAEDTGTSSLAKPGPAPPMTEQQIAKLGNAGVYNAQSSAIDEQKAAARRMGEANADQMTAVGNAQAAAADEERRILEQRARVAEDNARALELKTNEYLSNAKAMADTKIDRTIDHPVMVALGLALSTIGSAMKGQDNSGAIKGVYDALDRKVAAQMQDLDLKQKGLAVQREGLDLQRMQGKDRLEQLDVYRLASIQQAARKIEAIKVQTSVPAVRAAADEVLAGLSVKHGEVLGAAQERWQQQKNAEANRAQAAQFHGDSMRLGWAQLEEQRQARGAALAEKLIDRKDAAGAARAKLIGEQAIIDPNTKDYLLTPAGQAKMQAADSIEAQARKDPTKPALDYVARLRAEHPDAKDPARANIDALEARVKTDPQVAARAAQEYANNVRDDARLNDAAIALNKKGGEEAQKAVAIAHDMSLKVDKAMRALEADPSPANREAWASLQTQFQFIKGEAAKGLGERVSVRAMEALDHVLSIDADSLWSRAADKGKALSALKTLRETFNQDAESALGTAGIKGSWQPAAITNSPDWEGQTAQEIADTTEGSGGFIGAIGSATTGDNPMRQQTYENALARTRKLADGSPGRPSTYGLEPNQEAMLDSLIKRADTAGHKEYERIVEDLTDPLLQISGEKARPKLAKAVAEKLRDADPKLLDAVLENIANRPGGGGEVRVAEIRAAIPKAPNIKSTPGSVEHKLSPAWENTPPKVLAYLQTLSPADRAKAIEWMRGNGVGAGAQ